MTFTQVIGLVLIWISVAALIGYGVGKFFRCLLDEDEQARKDLAQDASPCRQTLGRYVR